MTRVEFDNFDYVNRLIEAANRLNDIAENQIDSAISKSDDIVSIINATVSIAEASFMRSSIMSSLIKVILNAVKHAESIGATLPYLQQHLTDAQTHADVNLSNASRQADLVKQLNETINKKES